MRLFLTLALWLGACTTVMAADYAIERLKGNVYRFSAGHYHSVLMVTEKGILLLTQSTKTRLNTLKGVIRTL